MAVYMSPWNDPVFTEAQTHIADTIGAVGSLRAVDRMNVLGRNNNIGSVFHHPQGTILTPPEAPPPGE